MKAFLLTLLATISFQRLIRHQVAEADLLDLSSAFTCQLSHDPLNYTLLIYGVGEGIFSKLKMTNGQRCVGVAEKTQEWIVSLVHAFEQCAGKNAQCYTDLVIYNLPTLMTVLSKLTTECPAGLQDVEEIYKKVQLIFEDFQGYASRLLASLYSMFGSLVNEFMNAYYGVCQLGQYKKAGVQFGEIIGTFISI